MPKWAHRVPLSIVWGSYAIAGGVAFGVWRWEIGAAANERDAVVNGIVFGPLFGFVAITVAAYRRTAMARTETGRWMRWSTWLYCTVAAAWLVESVTRRQVVGFLLAVVFALLFLASLGGSWRKKRESGRTWWRPVSASAVAAVMVGAGIVVFSGSANGQVHGPFGTFPEMIGTPTGPARLGATVPDGAPIYHGIIIESESARVSAVNARTGAVYWKWDGPDDIVGTAVDPQTEIAAVLSVSPRKTADVYHLTVIGLRTGKVRWQRAVPGRPDDPTEMRVLDASGAIAVAGNGGMSAFDPGDGHRRWGTTWSGDCQVRPFSQALGGLLVIGLTCGNGSSIAVYDPASGTRRWSLPTTWLIGDGVQWNRDDNVAVNGGTLVVWSWETTAIVDLATGRLRRVAGSRRGELAGAIGAGVEVTACRQRTRKDAPTGLCAIDPVGGRTLWRYRMPRSWSLAESTNAIVAAQGHVYALAVNDAGEMDLLVLDSRTGRQTGQATLVPATRQSPALSDRALSVVAADSIAFHDTGDYPRLLIGS